MHDGYVLEERTHRVSCHIFQLLTWLTAPNCIQLPETMKAWKREDNRNTVTEPQARTLSKTWLHLIVSYEHFYMDKKQISPKTSKQSSM